MDQCSSMDTMRHSQFVNSIKKQREITGNYHGIKSKFKNWNNKFLPLDRILHSKEFDRSHWLVYKYTLLQLLLLSTSIENVVVLFIFICVVLSGLCKKNYGVVKSQLPIWRWCLCPHRTVSSRSLNTLVICLFVFNCYQFHNIKFRWMFVCQQ